MTSIFGIHKVNKGAIEDVIPMVEKYFRGRGLDASKQEMEGFEGCGWWLTEGSAKVYIFVQESPSGNVLRITSPLVHVPEHNREAFYRKLLEINADLTGCALAIYQDVVLVATQRHTLALDQEELDALVWNVAYVADLLDNKLASEFSARMY